MSYKLELAICSCDTSQQMPCFDRCQLTITWMSSIKEVLSLLPFSWSMAALSHDSVLNNIMPMHPLPIPLAMITVRKSIHGFPFLSHMGIVLHFYHKAGQVDKIILFTVQLPNRIFYKFDQ